MSGIRLSRRSILKAVAGGTAAITWGPQAVRSLGAETTTGPSGSLVRIGLIGLGNRGKAHLRSLAAMPDRCRIAALCDIVGERAQESAKLSKGESKAFTNHADLLSSGLCDAVVVATPNYTHKTIAIDALRAGHHVLCEKPLATTLADAKTMVDTARQAGRILAVGLQMRYLPVYRKVRELLAAGAIGELQYVWAEEFRGDWARLYDDPKENARKNWRYYQELSGGTLVEKNCHDFDVLGWVIGGQPVRVAALGGNSVYKDRETIDHASVIVDYDHGIQLTLGVCLFAKAGRDDTVFVGTQGNIEFPRGGNRITLRGPNKKNEVINLSDGPADTFGHRGTRDLHVDFLNAVVSGRTPLADARIGYAALRIPIAAEMAVRQHKVIELKTLEG